MEGERKESETPKRIEHLIELLGIETNIKFCTGEDTYQTKKYQNHQNQKKT
jgi:hypothetical protein